MKIHETQSSFHRVRHNPEVDLKFRSLPKQGSFVPATSFLNSKHKQFWEGIKDKPKFLGVYSLAFTVTNWNKPKILSKNLGQVA